MSTAMTRDRFDAHIASRSAYLDTVMYQEEQRHKPMFRQFVHTKPMNRFSKEIRDVRGLGLMKKITSEIPDQWPYDAFEQGRKKNYIAGWYGSGVQLSKQFMMDDVDDIGAERGRALVQSAQLTQEYYAASIFNNATSTDADRLLPDAKALAASDHPLIDDIVGVVGAATWSNYIAAVLSVDSLNDAVHRMIQTPDDLGVPIRSGESMKLVHHPAQTGLVHELLRSIGKPGTDYNDVNFLGSLSIVPVAWHMLRDDGHCALQGPQHQIFWMDRQAIQTESTTDFDNKSVKMTVDAMWTFGPFGWRHYVLIDDGTAV